MKKFILGIIICVILLIPTVTIAKIGLAWWPMGPSTEATRFYDHDNDLVCWVARQFGVGGGISIDCEKIKR